MLAVGAVFAANLYFGGNREAACFFKLVRWRVGRWRMGADGDEDASVMLPTNPPTCTYRLLAHPLHNRHATPCPPLPCPRAGL